MTVVGWGHRALWMSGPAGCRDHGRQAWALRAEGLEKEWPTAVGTPAYDCQCDAPVFLTNTAVVSIRQA